MGWSIGFGIGPVRYRTSLSGRGAWTSGCLVLAVIYGAVVVIAALVYFIGGAGTIAGLAVVAVLAGFGIRAHIRKKRSRHDAELQAQHDIADATTRFYDQIQARSDADAWAFAVMKRLGWSFRHSCDHCGRRIATGAQSHVCENTSGWSWDRDITTRIMDGNREIGSVTGYQTGWAPLTEITQASPEAAAIDLTDEESTQCDRIREIWDQGDKNEE